MSRDAFEQRLKRLKAADEAQETAQAKAPTPQTGPIRSARAPRKKRSLSVTHLKVLFGAIVLGFTGLVMGGGLSPDGFSVAELRQELIGPDTGKSRENREAVEAEPRYLTLQGWAFNSPGVASAGLPPLMLADIATGFEDATAQTHPAKLTPFTPNRACTLRRPQPEEVVHNVRLETGNLHTPVHAFSNAELSEALIDQVEGLMSRTKRHYKLGRMVDSQMAMVDVFVTDTSAPVYLVLQGFRAHTIWNVHAAPGVQIAHVAMIGAQSAVAGLTAPATFEAIRISDFVTDFEYGVNEEPRPCMVAPYLPPQAEWTTIDEARSGNKLMENYLYSQTNGAEAYRRWYLSAVGIEPSTNMVAVKHAAHVLVGPRPTAPLAYAPLTGRTAYITNADRFAVGDTQLQAIHQSVLTAAAGGDLTRLVPPPVQGDRP
ncbi:hypothetical protein [Sulfitobacter sp. S190]|uniref:hypothetical protein n=1 Tax=Sulfitobacter sp. S190 TaxID=2867022 RepID=UPI0021A5D6FA|nr:hypothetical protein [Sulfitobacter sp. S190]UWR24553.1 hypothetical protein K3756_18765 [Sulfitobacter sp. S190]